MTKVVNDSYAISNEDLKAQLMGDMVTGAGMTKSGSYGLFLPDIGAIILNDSALALTSANGGISLPIATPSNTDSTNPLKMFF